MNKKDIEQQYNKVPQNPETRKERLDREHRIVADHIQDLMNSVNWQPADLCKNAEIDSGNLSKALKGQRGVSGYTLYMIEQAVLQEKRLRRQRASFRDERSEAVRKRVLPPVDDMMTHDGLSPDKVDGVCESIVGIIKSAYAP